MNRNPATATQDNPQVHKTREAPENMGQTMTAKNPVIYEQPLNERIRTLLRLEFLFRQAHTHIYRHSSWDSRAGINALFDIVNIFSRTDLRTEIMKELERQASYLEQLAENPHVDKKRLDTILDEMDALIDRLHSVRNQDMDIRGNEFLSSIKQRSSIAGGCCDFDVPIYHFWLSQPEEKRTLDLQQWLEPFDAINQSVTLIMRLIRDSGQISKEIAESGFFQKSLDPNNTCQMLRVTLPAASPYFAEISGGKHRFSIRFMAPCFNERPSQTDRDIAFELTCCML